MFLGRFCRHKQCSQKFVNDNFHSPTSFSLASSSLLTWIICFPNRPMWFFAVYLLGNLRSFLIQKRKFRGCSHHYFLMNHLHQDLFVFLGWNLHFLDFVLDLTSLEGYYGRRISGCGILEILGCCYSFNFAMTSKYCLSHSKPSFMNPSSPNYESSELCSF